MKKYIKLTSIILTSIVVASSLLHAENESIDRDKYLLDSNYINGMMYLKGKKGVSTIIKEITNCPYSKCISSDVSEGDISGTIKIQIDKPNYIKAVEELTKSVEKGNFLAAEKLITFLIKRIDYKSKYPDKFILEMLKNDTNLNLSEYKNLVKKTVEVGANSKGCITSFYYGDLVEHGYLGFKKSEEESQIYYKKAVENCPLDSYYITMANNKIK